MPCSMRDATPHHPSARSRTRAAAATTIVLALGLGLAACAPEPEPATTRDALTDVTEEPTASPQLDEWNAELNPEPVVDPLECTPYLVLTARGTDEPSDGQLLSPVARTIADARPYEVQTRDLDYPADAEIQLGGTQGVRTVVDTLNVQAEACPDQSFVLLGYSQGALVTGDALLDPDVRLVGRDAGEVSPGAARSIRAIVFYGDPRFVGAEAYNVGSFDPDLNGLLPRPPGSLDAYADRMRDYCVDGDMICQSSLALDEAPHVAYFDNGMQFDGAAFAITQLLPSAELTEPVGGPDADDETGDASDAADETPGDAGSGVAEN